MKRARVLLADDHEVVRRGIRALLESRQDIEVVGEAVDGRDAVEKAKKLKPDVVILDITMAGMNGLEATRYIVKDNPVTKVLILTIHDSESVAGEALKAGARGYLLKTDAGRELLIALDALRNNKPYFTPAIANMMLNNFRGDEPKTGDPTRLQKLTLREREIFQLLAEAKSSKEIAQVLNISLKTVDAHRTNIMSKLDIHSVAELVRYAIREGVIAP